MPKKILITGGTGFIGSRLCEALLKRGDELTLLTRSPGKVKSVIPGKVTVLYWKYKEKGEWQAAVNGKDAVIHLAGANLFAKRWDEEYKKAILESRQLSTNNIADAIAKASQKPEVFICASAVGYYGNYGEDVITEEDHSGEDFLSMVCRVWEEEAAKVEKYDVRRVSVRTGIVLSKEEGALKQMLTPFRLFVGGSLGNGKQWFPWIHIDDIIGAYLYAIDNNNISGAVNASAPDPVRMKDFAKTLGKILNRPSLFNVPKFAMKIALGEFAESILYSQKVIPKKLLEEGFKFEYEVLEEALSEILK